MYSQFKAGWDTLLFSFSCVSLFFQTRQTPNLVYFNFKTLIIIIIIICVFALIWENISCEKGLQSHKGLTIDIYFKSQEGGSMFCKISTCLK